VAVGGERGQASKCKTELLRGRGGEGDDSGPGAGPGLVTPPHSRPLVARPFGLDQLILFDDLGCGCTVCRPCVHGFCFSYAPDGKPAPGGPGLLVIDRTFLELFETFRKIHPQDVFETYRVEDVVTTLQLEC